MAQYNTLKTKLQGYFFLTNDSVELKTKWYKNIILRIKAIINQSINQYIFLMDDTAEPS